MRVKLVPVTNGATGKSRPENRECLLRSKGLERLSPAWCWSCWSLTSAQTGRTELKQNLKVREGPTWPESADRLEAHPLCPSRERTGEPGPFSVYFMNLTLNEESLRS